LLDERLDEVVDPEARSFGPPFSLPRGPVGHARLAIWRRSVGFGGGILSSVTSSKKPAEDNCDIGRVRAALAALRLLAVQSGGLTGARGDLSNPESVKESGVNLSIDSFRLESGPDGVRTLVFEFRRWPPGRVAGGEGGHF